VQQTGDSWGPAKASALEYTWGEYRVWAATARRRRAEIFSWRFYVLLLTIIGAILGTLSQTTTSLGFESESWVSQTIAGLGFKNEYWAIISTALGLLSGILIALATFFTREILRPEREQHWIRTRSIAEALKSETYLFRSQVPPYDMSDAAIRLNERTEELLKTVKDVTAVMLPVEQRRERLPEGPLSVEQYIEERVDDQINNYYEPRVQEYQAVMERGRNISLGLGALAAVLGVLGATGWTAGWVAVITTITVATANYLYAGRYQYLIISYQATARQLIGLKNRWKILSSVTTESDKRNQFIRECENAISIENSAWMSKWIEHLPKAFERKA
jgi:hypothetical protein